MGLIAELSQDVAKDYREKQKTKLQRTFVKASDAASSKAKGLSAAAKHSSAPSHCPDQEKEQKPAKRPRLDTEKPFGSLVLIQYPNHPPQSTIQTSTGAAGLKLEFKYQNIKNNNSQCEIFVNNKKLTEAVGRSQKIARKEAAEKGIEVLRKYYYTIEIKELWQQNVDTNAVYKDKMNGEEKTEKPGKSEECLGENNVGAKLMKLMGWAGGGLGKSEQGITEPIAAPRKVSRRGFGMQLSQTTSGEFKQKFRETLRQYIREGSINDLVFYDFDKDERAIMHQAAIQMGLKTQSYGPKDQRTLTISRKIDPCDLVQELLEIGGTSQKYILKAPTGS